jgi:hypothetical protein
MAATTIRFDLHKPICAVRAGRLTIKRAMGEECNIETPALMLYSRGLMSVPYISIDNYHLLPNSIKLAHVNLESWYET